ILAILFNMNLLWKEYLYQCLRKRVKTKFQNIKYFWENKTIRPDLVIEISGKTYVIDAKWKALSTNQPADSDLKQMYVYHHYWQTAETILAYPNANNLTHRSGRFKSTATTLSPLTCHLVFLDVIDENGSLNPNIHTQILNRIEVIDHAPNPTPPKHQPPHHPNR
ncbi:MAG: hypothetical protein AB8G22_28835, partial [Saprospiraceae bacterium]